MTDSPAIETPAPLVEAVAPTVEAPPQQNLGFSSVLDADLAAIRDRLAKLEAEAKHWLGNRAAGVLNHVEAIRELLP